MQIINISSWEDFEKYLNKSENIIVNITATWCKPCIAIKPLIQKFISVIEEQNFMYLIIDHYVYETNSNFDIFFTMKKIPYFIFIKNKKIEESLVSGDFSIVSKKIFDFVSVNKNSNLDTFSKNDDF
jgi:thiol-disulfide isomerase/thioredoxin